MTADLILLGLSMLTWGFGEGMFYIFEPIYLQQLGANPLQIGYILGALGIAMAIAHIPAGYMADKIGRRPMLWASWILGALATVVMAVAPNLLIFTIGMLLYGLTAFVVSPLNSYVTTARGKLSVGRAFTLISAMYSTGAVLGPLVGGWIGSAQGLRMAYVAASGVFVLSTIMVLFLRPQPTEHHDEENPPLNLLANRRYLGFMSVAFLVMFATYLPQPLTPNFLQNQRGLSIDTIGQIGALNNLGNVLLNLLLGSLNARLGFLLGQAAVGLFTILMWRGSGLPAYALGYFLLGGYRAARPLIAAQVRNLVHQAQMGLAYGITETINTLPQILTPPIAGLLYIGDPASVYPISLVLIVISILVSLKFAPQHPPAGEPSVPPIPA